MAYRAPPAITIRNGKCVGFTDGDPELPPAFPPECFRCGASLTGKAFFGTRTPSGAKFQCLDNCSADSARKE